MNTLRELFTIRREERWLAVGCLLMLVSLQVLMVGKFWGLFANYVEPASWTTFVRNFHISGFDPTAWRVLTHGTLAFDPLRHPLLAFVLWPLYGLNKALWTLTGCNCAPILMATLLTVCALYSLLFLYRIMRQTMHVSRAAATLLTLFFFSFAYVVTAMIVPDHFCLSLFMLTLTLCRASEKMGKGEWFGMSEAALLLTLTAGITLTNGVAVGLAVLFVNGCNFFRPRFLLGAVVAPAVLLLAVAFTLDLTAEGHPATVATAVGDQLKWTNGETPRTAVIVENLFGESIQMHRRHFLGDVLTSRPVIVEYSWKVQYAVESVIIALFAGGVFAGRRQRYTWLLMSILAFNLILHIGLGFAADEVYIMAAHWTYVIPLSMAWLFALPSRKFRLLTGCLVGAITIYLLVYHGYLLLRNLTWPLVK